MQRRASIEDRLWISPLPHAAHRHDHGCLLADRYVLRPRPWCPPRPPHASPRAARSSAQTCAASAAHEEAHLPTAYAPCEREAHAHAQPRPLSCSGRCCTRAILVTSGVAWARRARAHAHTALLSLHALGCASRQGSVTHDPHVLARSSLPSRHPPQRYRRRRPRARPSGRWSSRQRRHPLRPRPCRLISSLVGGDGR